VNNGSTAPTVGTEDNARITIEESVDEDIHLDGLSVAQHDGRIMIDEADTVIGAGQKVLLMGESGIGKSTLIRAIAGLWPWGSGSVRLPTGSKHAPWDTTSCPELSERRHDERGRGIAESTVTVWPETAYPTP
jgi:ABC-type uncharacterized transport system fused permease/ATPase subunit